MVWKWYVFNRNCTSRLNFDRPQASDKQPTCCDAGHAAAPSQPHDHWGKQTGLYSALCCQFWEGQEEKGALCSEHM